MLKNDNIYFFFAYTYLLLLKFKNRATKLKHFLLRFYRKNYNTWLSRLLQKVILRKRRNSFPLMELEFPAFTIKSFLTQAMQSLLKVPLHQIYKTRVFYENHICNTSNIRLVLYEFFRFNIQFLIKQFLL